MKFEAKSFNGWKNASKKIWDYIKISTGCFVLFFSNKASVISDIPKKPSSERLRIKPKKSQCYKCVRISEDSPNEVLGLLNSSNYWLVNDNPNLVLSRRRKIIWSKETVRHSHTVHHELEKRGGNISNPEKYYDNRVAPKMKK